jgi:hypothetical protein
MIENRFTDQVVEKVSRVLRADNLADLDPEDLDVFLATVDPEPFSEETVQRMVSKGRSPRGQNRTQPHPDWKGMSPRPKRKFRLTFEQLERRMLPSGCSLVEPSLSAPDSPPALLRLWQEERTVYVDQGDSAFVRPGYAYPGRGLAAETVNLIFAHQELSNNRDAAEAIQMILAWNLLSTQSLRIHSETAQFQLAS